MLTTQLEYFILAIPEQNSGRYLLRKRLAIRNDHFGNWLIEAAYIEWITFTIPFVQV